MGNIPINADKAADKTAANSRLAGAVQRFGVTGIAAIVWLEYALSNLILALRHPSGLPLVADDAMRLVQVRDLLAGQSWFDVTQWRMDPPLGVAMHWSRLIDAPLAGLILLFGLFTSRAMAEIWAVSVWPLLLLLAVWLASARIAQRLVDREAGVAALLLSVACVFTLGYFHPGEIDHHNAHIALSLWTVAFLMESERTPRDAALAAALSVVSLAIGLETLPYVIAVVCVMAGIWIVKGDDCARSVRAFGLCFAAAALILLFTVVASRERWSMDNLSFSGIHAALCVAGGLGLAALTYPRISAADRLRRFAGLALLAAVLFGALLVAAPGFFAGPYDWISPELNRVWLSRIEEARSPMVTAALEPGFFFATYVYALLGVLASLLALVLVDRDRRLGALVLVLLSCVALLVSTYEVRGAPFAILFCVPGMAAAVRLLALRFMRPGWTRAAAMILGLAALSNFTFMMIGAYAIEGIDHVVARNAARDASLDCMGEKAVQPLIGLPIGQVAAFIDIPPAILLYTPHSVMAGSYRDPDAILDTYKLFSEPPGAARQIVARRHVSYVMTCATSNDYAFYKSEGGSTGLLSQLDKGVVPGWLAPLPPGGPHNAVRVYRVLRASN